MEIHLEDEGSFIVLALGIGRNEIVIYVVMHVYKKFFQDVCHLIKYYSINIIAKSNTQVLRFLSDS